MGDQNIEQMDKGLPQVKFWERNLQRTEVDIQNHIKFYNLDYEFIDKETLLERIEELEGGLKDAREHVASLPENAFGALDGHRAGYWIRDQIIDEISGILRVTDGIKQEPKDNVTTDMFDEPTNKG